MKVIGTQMVIWFPRSAQRSWRMVTPSASCVPRGPSRSRGRVFEAAIGIPREPVFRLCFSTVLQFVAHADSYCHCWLPAFGLSLESTSANTSIGAGSKAFGNTERCRIHAMARLLRRTVGQSTRLRRLFQRAVFCSLARCYRPCPPKLADMPVTILVGLCIQEHQCSEGSGFSMH